MIDYDKKAQKDIVKEAVNRAYRSAGIQESAILLLLSEILNEVTEQNQRVAVLAEQFNRVSGGGNAILTETSNG